jgi:hypothetical protein
MRTANRGCIFILAGFEEDKTDETCPADDPVLALLSAQSPTFHIAYAN